MQWYYSQKSSQLGPVSEAELRERIAAGEVSGADMVWHEGMSDWMPMSTVKELQQVPAPPVPGTGIPDASSPYASPATTGAPYAAPSPTSGLAIASFVCGLLGLFTCFLPGIPAVICGHMAMNRIKESSGQIGGRGFATVGLVTGYLSVVMLVGVVILMLVGVAAGNLH